MSHSTRARIASSLLALSLLASGCGAGSTHDSAEVRSAFAQEGFDLSAAPAGLLRLFSERPPVRPLDALLARVRLGVSSSGSLPRPTPAPTDVLFGDDV